MGLILLLALSLFFGAIFSETERNKRRRLQLLLGQKDIAIEKLKSEHEYQVKLLKNTIRELL